MLCGTASAGYSISSMLTTRRKKTPGTAGSIRGAAAPDGPSEEIEALAGESFDWLANLGAPAALVAGAIMATLVEQGDFLRTTTRDTKQWARYMKRSAHVLLITALAMSLFSIFGTTVTGTMLKGLGDGHKTDWVETTSPMAFMHQNLPFEFLICRFCFLQGLLNWMLGLSLMYIGNAPAAGGKASTKIYFFFGFLLLSVVMLMVAFLNKHMSFYANYMGMVAHFAEVFVKQYFLCENVRPMAWTAAAVFFTSFKYLVEAIVAEDDDDDDDDEPKRRASRPRHEPLVQIQKNLETPDRGGRPPVVSSVSGYARAAKMVQDESAPTPVESMTYAAPVRARKVSCRLP
jgi:hypothetical protein